MSDAPMIFQFIGEQVDRAMNTFIAVTSSQVISDFTLLAIAGATVYFVLFGYMIMAGRVQQPMSGFITQCVKYLLIGGFALSADIYMSWVVSAIQGLENGLASAFATTGTGGDPISVYATVDESLGKGWAISGDLWEKAGNRGMTDLGMAIGEYINATLIAIATLLVGLPAGAMIVIAKAALTLLLGIGPFFIMCLMWSATAKWFDAWFSLVMNRILTIALLAAVASFAIKIFDAFAGGVNLESDQNPLFTALSLLVLALVMMGLLYKAADMAAGLAGGISSGALTFGQMAASAAGLANAPGAAARGVNNMVNPQSTRLDPKTGHQTTSRRLEHAAMGRTVVNPAYRAALKERMASGWARSPGGSLAKG